MVEFTLPANSKVQKGINHPIKEVSEKTKKSCHLSLES